MKKNFVRVMLFGALTLAVTTTVTSCKDYDDDIKGLQEQVDNIKSTNPVSTEDMKAAVDAATKALEKKVKDLQDLVDGKVTATDLEAKIKELEGKLAAGDKTVADALAAAKTELTELINGKASQATVDAINRDIEALKGMKTTLQALIDAEGWKIVQPSDSKTQAWELYDLNTDRSEMFNLASKYPNRVKAMVKRYLEWEKQCKVVPRPAK